MAPISSSLRKAIGAVKDRTSIVLAKLSGSSAPELEVLVVKATSHGEDPAGERHLREIVDMTLSSRGHAISLAAAVARRLRRTRDWTVALKCLALVHRVLAEGHVSFGEEILEAERGGLRVLDLSGFRDEAHSRSWDHSSFVRLYASYLDARVRDLGEFDRGTARRLGILGEMRQELELVKYVRILDRSMACRPAGEAERSRLVAAAFCRIVEESFAVYREVCEALKVLVERLRAMEDCAKALDVCAAAKKMVDKLAGFYGWCEGVGIARLSDFAEVKKVSDEAVETLEKALAPPPWKAEEVINGVKELVDLRDVINGVSADERGNELALSLFSGAPSATEIGSSWVAFRSPETASAAAETGKPEWELLLDVESAANLKQRFGGGFDPSLLDGVYDRGGTHVTATSVGPAAGRGEDPFAASACVEMAEEQRAWRHYGMHGQMGIGGPGGVINPHQGGGGGYYYYPPY